MNKFQANNLIKTADFCNKKVNSDGTVSREIVVNKKVIAVINETIMSYGRVFFVHIANRSHQIAGNLNQAFAMCVQDFIDACDAHQSENARIEEIKPLLKPEDARNFEKTTIEIGGVAKVSDIDVKEVIHFDAGFADRRNPLIVTIHTNEEGVERFTFAIKRFIQINPNASGCIKVHNGLVFSVISVDMPNSNYFGYQSDLRDYRHSISVLAGDHDKGVRFLLEGDVVSTQGGDAMVEHIRQLDGAYLLENESGERWYVYNDGTRTGKGYNIEWEKS